MTEIAPPNPFWTNFQAERVRSRDYVELFSPRYVDHHQEIFTADNLVITGAQGCGKSMLLKLLDTDVRIAYSNSKQKGQDGYPVKNPETLKFIAASVNLTTCGVVGFRQRKNQIKDLNLDVPLLFGDFLNYEILSNLFRSIARLKEENGAPVASEIGMNLSEIALNKFAEKFSKKDSLIGYYKKVGSFQDLVDLTQQRLMAYTQFINSGKTPPEHVLDSVGGIGEPLVDVVEALREASVVDDRVTLITWIDQYETLNEIDSEDLYSADQRPGKEGLGGEFRRIINKALSLRKGNVSYRIATRPYGWDQEHTIYGSKGKLDVDRDYVLLNLEKFFRRREYSKIKFFEDQLAPDVFRRRLQWKGLLGESRGDLGKSKKDETLQKFFGKTKTPEEKAKTFSKASRRKVIQLRKGWPQKWKDFLFDLAEEDPLSARLGEAWARQRGKEKQGIVHNPPKKGEIYPWVNKDIREWWVKERKQAALMQIASRTQQAMVYGGEKEILGLSGGNITVFLSICREIWDAASKAGRNPFLGGAGGEPFYINDQTLGIRTVSGNYFRKIGEGIGDSESRTNFVRKLGENLYKSLSADKPLSYPGGTGFSLSVEDLNANSDMKFFLEELCKYSILYRFSHTTKEKDGKIRKKWYLNPILCPYFRIPYQRTKEPFYWHVEDLRKIKGGGFLIDVSKKNESDGQLDLELGFEEE